MSCFEKLLLFLISLLLVDEGVELLLSPKMSSSSSSSSPKKDAALAFLVVDLGFTFWKRVSVLSSKMDGSVLLSLSFFKSIPLLAWGCVVLVGCLVDGTLVIGAPPNRLSEPKRSSSSGDSSSSLLLLLSFTESFSALEDTGSFSSDGLAEVWEGKGEEEGSAVGAAKLVIVGLAREWLDLSDVAEGKPDRMGFGPRTSPLRVPPLSSIDFRAACCLAVLDWGLRSEEPLARLCTTGDSR